MSKRTLISIVAAGAALSIGAAIWAAGKPTAAGGGHCANCANAANPCNPCGGKAANPCNPCGGKAADLRNLNLDKAGVALSGYDAVSYFKGEKPMKGDSRFRAEHKGVKYQFASEKNLGMFKAQPDKYVPAYGGWCAYAMADGLMVEVDPVNYKIKDGRLLLFYRDFLTNTLTKWNKAEGELYPKAEQNWAKLTGIASATTRPSAAGNPCNPCSGKKAANPCSKKNAANPCNPCAKKAANPCNPCSGKRAANPCSPCSGKKAENPCASKAQNPCGGK